MTHFLLESSYNNLTQVWEKTVLAMIGQTLDPSDKITGARFIEKVFHFGYQLGSFFLEHVFQEGQQLHLSFGDLDW